MELIKAGKKVNRTWKSWLKILLSVLILWFLFNKVDWQQYVIHFSKISLASLALAIFAYQLSKLAMSWRLHLLARRMTIKTSYWDHVKITYRSSLFALIMPGSIGGDGYRWLRLKTYPGVTHRSVMKLLFFDRFSGLVALIALLLLCLSISSSFDRELSGSMRLLFATISILAIYTCYWALCRRWFPTFYPSMRHIELSSYGVQIGQALVILALASNYWTLQHDMSGLVSLFLLSSLISLLPITFGGIGSREVVFFYGADFIHLPQEAGLILGSLFYAINVGSALPGLLMNDPGP